MTKRTGLHELERRWFRGPAYLDGETVVLDTKRGVAYSPLAESRIGLELTRVRTADDAVKFVERFGLLTFGAVGLDVIVGQHAREPVEHFISAANQLRMILKTIVLVRHAVAGNPKALATVRGRFTTKQPKVRNEPRDWYPPEARIAADADDRTLLLHASEWATWQLSIRLKETRSFVFDRAAVGESCPPGHVRVGILPRTLLDMCVMSAAVMLAEKEPVEICPECERVFVVEDGRQRFCTPTCANRARFRRFKQNQSQRKGGRHAKKTRKG